MKKAQYYRSCKGRKTTAKAVKDTAAKAVKTATTVANGKKGKKGMKNPSATTKKLMVAKNQPKKMTENVIGDDDLKILEGKFSKDDLELILKSDNPADRLIVKTIESRWQIQEYTALAIETVKNTLAGLFLESQNPRVLPPSERERLAPSSDFLAFLPGGVKDLLQDFQIPEKEIVVNRLLYAAEQLVKQTDGDKIPLTAGEQALCGAICSLIQLLQLANLRDYFLKDLISTRASNLESLGNASPIFQIASFGFRN